MELEPSSEVWNWNWSSLHNSVCLILVVILIYWRVLDPNFEIGAEISLHNSDTYGNWSKN